MCLIVSMILFHSREVLSAERTLTIFVPNNPLLHLKPFAAFFLMNTTSETVSGNYYYLAVPANQCIHVWKSFSVYVWACSHLSVSEIASIDFVSTFL